MSKLTIIKVLGHGDAPTSPNDLERWRNMFSENKCQHDCCRMTLEKAKATGEVEISEIDVSNEDGDKIMFVRVGDDNYKPSVQDLESWRKVFEEAKGDPDFKIFTHPHVEIDVINIGKIVAIE